MHLNIILSTFLLNENVSYENFKRLFEELPCKSCVHNFKKTDDKEIIYKKVDFVQTSVLLFRCVTSFQPLFFPYYKILYSIASLVEAEQNCNTFRKVQELVFLLHTMFCLQKGFLCTVVWGLVCMLIVDYPR